MAEPRLNLGKATVLLVQASATELDILGQMFIGFGVKGIRKCTSVEDAEAVSATQPFDLMVVDCDIPDGAGYDFVQRLRRAEENANRLAPIMLVCGHAAPSNVERARDCGANFVVAKPLTPPIVYDRLMWMAREQRQWVEAEGYVGPDRRHKAFGPPAGEKGRRHDDLGLEVGLPIGPDLEQDEIDALMNPRRAVA
ncbi:response regulator [Phenylobacterium sp. J367]|uniref:response regulator n=1 Tax=Phenylobacterium sp. J367 TaxID=2898435 RepID=UPI002151078A|nr:response regulator [Phenylobacterium sp. J367]MCR5877637.1 response regulator [Phenylobacterium sp. J367]